MVNFSTFIITFAYVFYLLSWESVDEMTCVVMVECYVILFIQKLIKV